MWLNERLQRLVFSCSVGFADSSIIMSWIRDVWGCDDTYAIDIDGLAFKISSHAYVLMFYFFCSVQYLTATTITTTS